MKCYIFFSAVGYYDFVLVIWKGVNILTDFVCHRLTNVDEEGHLYGVSGGSGGYAETIFRHAAKILFGKEIEGPLDFRTIRNSDFREVTLEVSIFCSSLDFGYLFFYLDLWS